jgi:NADH:ubiquinone oxidoreductase subunit
VTAQLLEPFLLTLAVSFLIGIGLREYYEGEKKFDTFGTVRTFVFVGMLGFSTRCRKSARPPIWRAWAHYPSSPVSTTRNEEPGNHRR